ncbi:MAG: septum site-determining protein MinC [Candidatus Eremiobacteraeota bacterium]|nr:septum site-determining protein MinC [Candidatus Eremiobacteraeota bacterium]
MIRGKPGGLEIAFSNRPFADALEELRARLGAVTDFYRGTPAVVTVDALPADAEAEELGRTLDAAGILWDRTFVQTEVTNVTALPVRERAPREVVLSERARSLVADFAGARADLAERRIRVPRRKPERPEKPAPPPVTPSAEPAAPAVLYHRGTLRGGQALANLGHIVVVGDVNPGAELVAGGDIVVFGALYGVAHAGAQGDASARVFALALAPTQLRIATTIAAGEGEPSSPSGPEEAFLEGDRIRITRLGEPTQLGLIK